LNELSFLTQAGLPPLEAIQAATITAARALDREADLGSVEEGKLADLLVLNGDPLDEIANIRNARLIVSGGEVYTPDDLVACAADNCRTSP
jgi:imidazolonepropionase-like amidohydrolase